jgi:hypothetical protein
MLLPQAMSQDGFGWQVARPEHMRGDVSVGLWDEGDSASNWSGIPFAWFW